MIEKPCECHGEPMRFNRDSRYKAGGHWSCRARQREQNRAAYARLNGISYNRKLLLQRRQKALARQRRRNSTGEMASG